jgi:hypothetical protein
MKSAWDRHFAYPIHLNNYKLKFIAVAHLTEEQFLKNEQETKESLGAAEWEIGYQ